MNEQQRGQSPAQLFSEYRAGIRFKAGLGERGLYEQNVMNERFFVGDQWHGANCGSDRPLVRHNVIKRIGEYKMAVVGSSPIAVNFTAEGVPNTVSLQGEVLAQRTALSKAGEQSAPTPIPDNAEVNLVMSALSDYFRVTAERVKFENIKECALRNAYTAGSSLVYTYWDERIKTGLYADQSRKVPLTGDIACEVLDIENVYFGDPNLDDIQEQPYILLAQRKSVAELRRMAQRYGCGKAVLESIKPDNEYAYMAGEHAGQEPVESAKATVLTKFWKEWNPEGRRFVIKAIITTAQAVIREEWNLGIRLYPFAKFSWERRRGCVYGESEITYLIPNQIAINRMITASVWAVMIMGMPIMVVNGDVVQQQITNDPGQVVPVYGNAEDVANAIRYVTPPNFSPAFDTNIMSLISNTLNQAGANNALLGDVRPDNAEAIIAVREAATMPLQTVQNRFNGFCEEIARVWAEFWVSMYGKRALKVEDDNGIWYMPFDGRRYRDMLISVKVDVGASTLWSESQSIKTLDNLFDRQVIDVLQYLSRLPKGTVPNLNGLLRELQGPKTALADTDELVQALSPAYREKLAVLSPAQQAQLLRKGGVQNDRK